MTFLSETDRQVLLISANDDLRRLIRLVFDQQRFDFVFATSIESAAVLAASQTADLIIIASAESPYRDWRDAAQQLRRRLMRPDLPIITLGIDLPDFAPPATGQSYDAYFTIPFSPYTFLLKAQDLLLEAAPSA